MIDRFLSIIVLLLAGIVGFLIARHTQEEVRVGRHFLEVGAAGLLTSVVLVLFSDFVVAAFITSSTVFFVYLWRPVFFRKCTWSVLFFVFLASVVGAPVSLLPVVTGILVLYALVAGSLCSMNSLS